MKTLRPLNFLLLLVAALALTLIFWLPRTVARAQPAPATAAPIEQQWNVDGVTRKALLYVPANATREKVPVLFAFHGHGGSMTQAARSFNFQSCWPEAIVVYMQGLDTPGQLTDRAGQRAGWQRSPGDQNDRDLKFFDAVYASLKADYRVDTSRVFASGHSNGGGFTYLLWATRGSILRAVGPSSAIPTLAYARNLTPKPVIHLAGERDPLVRFAWQERTIEHLKTLNACSADGTPWAKAGTIVGTEYASRSGNPVVTLLQPGGHRFPPEASALIVRFFKEVSSGTATSS